MLFWGVADAGDETTTPVGRGSSTSEKPNMQQRFGVFRVTGPPQEMIGSACGSNRQRRPPYLPVCYCLRGRAERSSALILALEESAG